MPPQERSAKSDKAVMEALQQLNHASAQDVHTWVNRAAGEGKKISLTSIYRALNHLVKVNSVKPLFFHDGQVRYELNTQHMHHHHFICTRCSAVLVIDECPYQALSEQLKSQFQVHYHNFELYGLCASCGVAQPAGEPAAAFQAGIPALTV